MKKIILLVLILCVAVFALVGCEEEKTYGDNGFVAPKVTGDIGDFSALTPETPENGAVLREIPVFSWTAAENALTYTLEIASNDAFMLDDELYIRKSGIVDTSFNLNADLKKNQDYYWRVTAVNHADSRIIDGGALSFYYEATLHEEIPLSVGYADEWKVHEVGSKATVSLDKKNFFNTGKESLKVSFDKEDTQRGEQYVESNGWVVVTRSLETEFYGVDAFYFNFYYSGNDAAAYFRLIDEDNEYWYAPIKLATNAKQTIIIRFSEFVLRTKGTPVMNEKFDYTYLKSVELVFERVDGDGIAYFSDLRAIRYDNYRDLFVESFDFDELSVSDKTEGSYFDFTTSVKNEGKELNISFTTNTDVPKDERGYGFVPVSVGKMFAKGDAFKMTVDLSDVTDSSYNFLIRLVEEDNDVWQFRIAASEVPDDGEMTIPFAAFVLAPGGFKGDGIKQFYYVKQILFGVNSLYQGGSITVGDITLVSLADELGAALHTVTVGEDGVVENFESYDPYYKVYYTWETSTANKDEAIEIYSEPALGEKNTAAKFGYKTDLPEANYTVLLSDAVVGYTAIEISAKDFSIQDADATMIVYLQGDPDELYSYTIENLVDDWRSYSIPLDEFSLTENSFGSANISCDRITAISIAFQYFYPKKGLFDFSDPARYNSGNFVCVDNIRFANATSYEVKEVGDVIRPTAKGSKIAVIDDFDEDTAETLTWKTVTDAEYAGLSLSAETASGSGQSLSMGYKCNMEAIYSVNIAVASSVNANGITLLMKGDTYHSLAVVVIYTNFENKVRKYQATISDIKEGWNTYSLGFGAFTQTEGATLALSGNYTKYVTEIVINYKNYSIGKDIYYQSNILLDEIKFDGNIAANANAVTPYGE